MADTKTTERNPTHANERLRSQANQGDNQSDNQTMQRERAKSEVGGREQGSSSGQRQDQGAIGGGDSRSQTGEPGRARNELDQDKNPSGQKSEFDKNRNEPASQR